MNESTQQIGPHEYESGLEPPRQRPRRKKRLQLVCARCGLPAKPINNVEVTMGPHCSEALDMFHAEGVIWRLTYEVVVWRPGDVD